MRMIDLSAGGSRMDREQIAARIPHAGTMCLLQAVVHWDASGIVCLAISHRDDDNPLRADGRLAGVCGIEYAAQAMAVHGSILNDARSGATVATSPANIVSNIRGRPRVGFLASVRAAKVHVARLDDIDGDLSISARFETGDTTCVVYSFAVQGDGRLLLEGRATVVLDSERLAP